MPHRVIPSLVVLLVLGSIVLCAAADLHAQGYIYEHFNYDPGPINGDNGGSYGWAGPWHGSSAAVVNSGTTITCNGQAPSGNALGPVSDVGFAPFRQLRAPVAGTPGTSLLLGAVITSDVSSGNGYAVIGNDTAGTSRFDIGVLGGYWSLVNGTAFYSSSTLVTPGVATCLVGQIDFDVNGGLDRMRLWINPPLNRLQVEPDIDVTSAHVSVFSGVRWTTARGEQTLDEISVNTAGGAWTSVGDVLGDRPLDTPLLQTNGTVLIHAYNTPSWRKLTPNLSGSYSTDFTQLSHIASMPSNYAPYAFASAVLPDGRLIVEGGEYNFGAPAETTLGAIYDPTKDSWQPVQPPANWLTIGDAPSVVLPDGTFMLGNCCTNDPALYDALLDPVTLRWRPTGANQAESNSEHGWELLPGMSDSPSGPVLVVNAYVSSSDLISQRYIPSSGSWVPAGSTIVDVWDCCFDNSDEVGPAILRPDGTVLAFGATFSVPAHTAIYHTASDPQFAIWTAGPDFPDDSAGRHIGVDDGPAALLPNGNVLVFASAGFYSPGSFLEITENNQWFFVPTPLTFYGFYYGSFLGQSLVLPTGQILFTNSGKNVYFYTPSNPNYDPAWAPQLCGGDCGTGSVDVSNNIPNHISGLRFNGMSQGAMFGDDAQMATNYPIIRISDSTHVYYCRTHDHTSMGVQTGNLRVSTFYECPGIPDNFSGRLEVVANGIPSNPLNVVVGPCTGDPHNPACPASAIGQKIE